MIAIAPLAVGTFVAAALGTALVRRYALARQVLDLPNARSSHTVPTPRGGGVAIVVAFTLAVLTLAALGRVPARTTIALVGGGLAVAIVGLIDDHRHVPAGRRLAAHFAAAFWVLWWLGGLPSLVLAGRSVDMGWLGDALAAVALVWLLNLYNFMDGIDGIAGVESVTVALGAAGLYFAFPEGGADPALPLALGVAAFGFLIWNLPPARIFMGDAGSGFLGLTLGTLALVGGAASPRWLFVWAILLGVFIVDATVTLVRRLLRGEPVHQAHRRHAYQRAARRAGRHGAVTGSVALINLLWLLPWATAARLGTVHGAVALVIAYLPLLSLALWLGAGDATE